MLFSLLTLNKLLIIIVIIIMDNQRDLGLENGSLVESDSEFFVLFFYSKSLVFFSEWYISQIKVSCCRRRFTSLGNCKQFF